MPIKQAPYLIIEDRGVLRVARRNAIIVTAEGEPQPEAFDSFADVAKRISKRKLKPIEQVQVKLDNGDIDAAATEEAIQSHYVDHYQLLMDLAVDWATGLVCERKQPNPVRYDGRLYEIEQTHTVVDPNHTPDVTPALYTVITEPTPGLDCPEFVQPTSTKYYNTGDCVAYTDGYYYESLIDANTWSPDQYPAGWERLGPI